MDYCLVWFIITVIYTRACRSCHPGWILYERFNVCYKVFVTPKLDWDDARNYCAKLDAKLTDIYDYEEQMFMKDTLLKTTNGHGVWVGASDQEDEGDFRWVDHTEADIHRFKWWQGNPNNGEIPKFLDSFFGEDCVEISLKSSYRGRLNDYMCMEKMPFICKKKDMFTSTTTETTSSMVTEQELSTESEDTSTIPIVSVLVALVLVGVLVTGAIFLIRRYRAQKSTNNYYEDANVPPSLNENFYTVLNHSDQPNINGACVVLDQSSLDESNNHEYHSVHFSSYEAVGDSKNKVDVLTKNKPTPKKYLKQIKF